MISRRTAELSAIKNAAIAAGKDTYFTGKPCKHGHIAERHVSTNACVDCSYKRLKNTMHYQFQQRKSKACKKGIPFIIEFSDIEQPEYCPVFGLKLNYAWTGKKGPGDPNKATLDRVIPELGYVPGNVYIISWRANFLKSDAKIEELEKLLTYMKEKINGQAV